MITVIKADYRIHQPCVVSLPSMLTIHLKDLRFKACHGLFEEELILDNDFEVDLSVSYLPERIPVCSIHETINYAELYELTKAVMEKPIALLETIATQLVSDIFLHFSMAQFVGITIRKMHPPLNNFEGVAAVSYDLSRIQYEELKGTNVLPSGNS